MTLRFDGLFGKWEHWTILAPGYPEHGASFSYLPKAWLEKSLDDWASETRARFRAAAMERAA